MVARRPPMTRKARAPFRLRRMRDALLFQQRLQLARLEHLSHDHGAWVSWPNGRSADGGRSGRRQARTGTVLIVVSTGGDDDTLVGCFALNSVNEAVFGG